MLKALDASAAALNHAFLLEQQDTIGHHRTPHTHNLSCSLGSDFDAMKLRREFCQVADGGYDSKPIFYAISALAAANICPMAGKLDIAIFSLIHHVR